MRKRKYRKIKYRKRTKRGRGKPYIRKNNVYFGGRRTYLRKNKVYFSDAEKEAKRREYIRNNLFDRATFSWRNCKSI